MEVLCVLSTLSLGERVKLDPEGDALLSTMLPGSELCADAVHLQTAGRRERDQNMRLMWNSVAHPTDGTKESLCVCVFVWFGR